MSAIREHLDRFAANPNYTEGQKEIARRWMKATRCSDLEVHVLVSPQKRLSEIEAVQRERIKKGTVKFIRRYFDERPSVVRSLDALFAELGMKDERQRRDEFFPFSTLYHQEEILILLLKHLQPEVGRGQYTQEAVAEYFLTSARTIREYIGELRPSASKELSARVFGQIVQMDPARGTNTPESTTHPLFLPLSMVELYTLVDVLIAHVNDEVEGRIIRTILKSVLDQTTAYAVDRIKRIEGFDEAMSTVSHLIGQRDHGDAVMFSEKENMRATVCFTENGVEKSCTGFISRNPKDKTIIDVAGKEGVHRIRYRDIISLTVPSE